MNISKVLRQKISVPVDNWFCKKAINRSPEPALSFNSVESMRKQHPMDIMFWFHPDTLLTADEIADESLFHAKKNEFGETSSVLYCVTLSHGRYLCVKYNSRTAFLIALKELDAVYAYATPPVELFPDGRSVPQTISLDDNSVFFDKSISPAPKFVCVSSGEAIARLIEAENYSPRLFTNANEVPSDEFWSLMPWELVDKYGDVYVITEENSAIIGTSISQWRNYRGTVNGVNRMRESIATQVAGDIYLFGTGSHDTIMNRLQNEMSVDRYAIIDWKDRSVVCTVPRSICEAGVEHLSVKQLYDVLPTRTFLPANFAVADLNTSKNAAPHHRDSWAVCIKNGNSSHVIYCDEEALIAYVSLFRPVCKHSYEFLGLSTDRNQRFISCDNAIHHTPMSFKRLVDICGYIAPDNKGVPAFNHIVTALLYILATDKKIGITGYTGDAVVTDRGLLYSKAVDAYVTTSLSPVEIQTDEDVKLVSAVRDMMHRVVTPNDSIEQRVTRGVKYARLMLAGKVIPVSIFAS